MSVPKLCWEASLSEELAANGATLRFIGMGKPDKSDDELLGWYVILVRSNGEHKLLVKQLKYEPRLFKTYAGIRSLVREHLPAWTTMTLPIVPGVRSEDEIWTLLDKMNSGSLQN
jgi:hypothetical protein